MELSKIFKDGLWSNEINVRDFVSHNITPYYGDASFLEGPTERTKAVWNRCLEALAEERKNNGVRSLDNATVSTISSHKAGYIDKENELIVGLQTDELLKRSLLYHSGCPVVRFFPPAVQCQKVSKAHPDDAMQSVCPAHSYRLPFLLWNLIKNEPVRFLLLQTAPLF